MRALHFMKIDYMLTRKQMYVVPVFFALAIAVGAGVSGGEGGTSLLVAYSYMLFVAAIFATAPFGYCAGKNRGFLLLLPATVKDRVAGRFLYGVSFVAVLGLLCGVLMGIRVLRGAEVPRMVPALALWEFAVSICIMALEFLFFYLFGEGKGNWQYLSNIVRVAPGMLVFFVASYMVERLEDASLSGRTAVLEAWSAGAMQAGVIAVVVSLLLTAAVAAICVKVIEKRDYA